MDEYWSGLSRHREFDDIFANDEEVPTCLRCGFPNGQGPEGNNRPCFCHPYVKDRTVGAGRPKPRITIVKVSTQPPLAINNADGTWYFDYSVPPPPLGQYDYHPPLNSRGFPAENEVQPPEVAHNIPPMNPQHNSPSNGHMPLMVVCRSNNEPMEYGANPPMHFANSPPVGYPVQCHQNPMMAYPHNASGSRVPHSAINHFHSPPNFATNPPINYNVSNQLTYPIAPQMILLNNPNMAYYNNAPMNIANNPMNTANSVPIHYGVPIYYITNVINNPNSAQRVFPNNQSTIDGTIAQPNVDTSFSPRPLSENNKEEDGAWGGTHYSHRPSPVAKGRGRKTGHGAAKVFHHRSGKKSLPKQITGIQSWSIVDIQLNKPLKIFPNEETHVKFQNHSVVGVKLLSHYKMPIFKYFSAPDYYLGKLCYSVQFESNDIDLIVFVYDLIITGVTECLIYEKRDKIRCKLNYRFRIPLIGKMFKRMDGLRPTRKQFMNVLANVTGIYIRTSDHQGIVVSKW